MNINLDRRTTYVDLVTDEDGVYDVKLLKAETMEGRPLTDSELKEINDDQDLMLDIIGTTVIGRDKEGKLR